MRNPFVPRSGGVLSADIAVPDHDREVKFYSDVLTTGSEPFWRNDLMNNLGMPIIGLGERIPEYESLPLQWMPHFLVDDVAASAANALELGGKEIMHSKTESGESQWAALQDPHGAAFGVIPVVPPDSIKPNERQGRIVWLSLAAADAKASRDFYQTVIGWTANSIEYQDTESHGVADAGFEMSIGDGPRVAEIRQVSDDDGIPPVWLLHLPVDDFDDSLKCVQDLGGEVVRVCEKSQNAVIRDPVGVFFAIQAESGFDHGAINDG